MTKTECFGFLFDDGSQDEIVTKAVSLIESGRGSYVVTPNPEIVLASMKDAALRDAIRSADMILADGVGLIWASKIQGKPLHHRLPGIDIALLLLKELSAISGSVYLLGAEPGVARLAGDHLASRFPGLKIAGTHHGYFPDSDDKKLLEEMKRCTPDLLLVCLGSPKQELWMKKHCAELPGILMIGLGGALDVFSGRIRRAPLLWRRLGLEWLFRLMQEPKRMTRMIHLPGIFRAALIEKGRKVK